MGQILKIFRIRKKSDPFNKEGRPTIFAINKNSIGRINTPMGYREYNMHLLPTNKIDFDKFNTPKKEKTRVIRIYRK